MKHKRALRVLSALRQGSSWPVIVDTGDERVFTKLRGAAQGTAPLVAEIVVGALADALGLLTPERCLVEIPAGVASADPHEELADLLLRSVGLNLGFRLLEGFRDVKLADAARIKPELAARIVWLDALVENPDRNARNPNLMIRAGEVRLIDHGAALAFQYDWPHVTEQSPRLPGDFVEQHLFTLSSEALREADAELAPKLDRDVLEAALAEVPDEFLLPLLPAHAGADELLRERAAYVAFLWKRLRAPRPFLRIDPRTPFQPLG